MKSLKYIVALALAAGLFQACDLERYPLTDLSEETFGIANRMRNWH